MNGCSAFLRNEVNKINNNKSVCQVQPNGWLRVVRKINGQQPDMSNFPGQQFHQCSDKGFLFADPCIAVTGHF